MAWLGFIAVIAICIAFDWLTWTGFVVTAVVFGALGALEWLIEWEENREIDRLTEDDD